jgi:uncharacterized damage-inducible protein DinB
MTADLKKPRSKAEIIQLLKDEGDRYAGDLESLSDEFVAQTITLPAGATPPSRSRSEMLMSVKEQEMHHRGQLMLIERMLGITLHLTRQGQARMTAMEARLAAQAAQQ